ncbi:hypothetical protein [Halorussus caseinilyticus]|uniref:Uncharacterized protein n=1 Tax=Halorussus caseinilyticus TaxID=3034025 RepID=A0ABD5WI08_9EURY
MTGSDTGSSTVTVDHLQYALDAAADDDLRAAAKWYALAGMEQLVEAGYEPCEGTATGVTYFLEAISADVRAENRSRARGHVRLVRPVLLDLAENATDACLRGLAREWLGDASLLVGERDALEQYRLAGEVFEEVAFDQRLFWGGTPAFDNAYGAMKAFLATYDIEYPSSYSVDFEDRVDAKRRAYRDVVDGA